MLEETEWVSLTLLRDPDFPGVVRKVRKVSLSYKKKRRLNVIITALAPFNLRLMKYHTHNSLYQY